MYIYIYIYIYLNAVFVRHYRLFFSAAREGGKRRTKCVPANDAIKIRLCSTRGRPVGDRLYSFPDLTGLVGPMDGLIRTSVGGAGVRHVYIGGPRICGHGRRAS